MRPIDADALIAELNGIRYPGAPYVYAGIQIAIGKVCDAPTIEERKTGKWIERESDTEDKENGFETVIVCSHCDFPATTFYSEDCESRTQIRTDFCPNCGVMMS